MEELLGKLRPSALALDFDSGLRHSGPEPIDLMQGYKAKAPFPVASAFQALHCCEISVGRSGDVTNAAVVETFMWLLNDGSE
jgi:hypothetical protein